MSAVEKAAQSTTLPAIGEAYGGGFFAGLIRIGSSTYGLIVAPKDGGEIVGEWGPCSPRSRG